MVASEELEPGIGWNYQGWIGDLAANPEMSSADIAVSIADQFMAACLSDNPNDLSEPKRHQPERHPDAQGAARNLFRLFDRRAGKRADAAHHQPFAPAHVFLLGKFSDASSDQVDFMSFLDATRQFAPNMASQLEATYRQCILHSTGTDMLDYLTGMSLFPAGRQRQRFHSGFQRALRLRRKLPELQPVRLRLRHAAGGRQLSFHAAKAGTDDRRADRRAVFPIC